MKPVSKAVLLSALAFPGAGQLYLKRYPAAILLIAVVTIALVLALVPVLGATQVLMTRIESGELTPGADLLGEVRRTANEVTASSGGPGIVLLLAWLAGIVHAWIAGRGRAP